MVGVYAQSEIEWTRVVRTTLGLRADVYQFSVSANDPANSGEGSTGLLSPKVGAVFGPWSGTELYANAGFGYHSNDLFDAEVADIDYFYASRLPGEPAEGVEDVHTHPAIPRTARVALEVSF
jgi:outer membrane receptor protein involved in Fe transport